MSVVSVTNMRYDVAGPKLELSPQKFFFVKIVLKRVFSIQVSSFETTFRDSWQKGHLITLFCPLLRRCTIQRTRGESTEENVTTMKSIFPKNLCVSLFPRERLVIVVSLQKYWIWKEQIAPLVKTVPIHHATWEFVFFQSSSIWGGIIEVCCKNLLLATFL